MQSRHLNSFRPIKSYLTCFYWVILKTKSLTTQHMGLASLSFISYLYIISEPRMSPTMTWENSFFLGFFHYAGTDDKWAKSSVRANFFWLWNIFLIVVFNSDAATINQVNKTFFVCPGFFDYPFISLFYNRRIFFGVHIPFINWFLYQIKEHAGSRCLVQVIADIRFVNHLTPHTGCGVLDIF